MNFAKKIINWCDTKTYKSVREDSMLTGFLSGAIEAFVGSAIIMYLPLIFLCNYWKGQADNK